MDTGTCRTARLTPWAAPLRTGSGPALRARRERPSRPEPRTLPPGRPCVLSFRRALPVAPPARRGAPGAGGAAARRRGRRRRPRLRRRAREQHRKDQYIRATGVSWQMLRCRAEIHDGQPPCGIHPEQYRAPFSGPSPTRELDWVDSEAVQRIGQWHRRWRRLSGPASRDRKKHDEELHVHTVRERHGSPRIPTTGWSLEGGNSGEWFSTDADDLKYGALAESDWSIQQCA